MPSTSSEVVNSVRLLFRDGTGLGESDGRLLDRFSREGDEGAFAILVERHGPMVLRVCRAILGDDDARDAFQATFLVLVRRMRRIDRARSVGPWLFGVARKTAVRARADAAKRRAREREAAEARARADDRPAESWAELYEELDRLPERYRAPLVLCHLQGCSVEQAADRLGCPRGTILSRLSRGRDQLRERLTRRGLAPLAALFPEAASPAVPPALADATVRAASTGTTSTAVEALVGAGAKFAGLFAAKAALSVATVGGLVAVALVLGRQTPSPAAPASAPGEVPQTPEKVDTPARGRLHALQISEQAGVAFVPRKVESLVLRGHTVNVIGAAFSPDGKLLATGDAGATLKFWDVATGRQEASLAITPLQGEHAAIMALDFSPDGRTLAMGCDDRTIRLRDVATRAEKLVLPRDYFPNTVTFSPDGATLAWAVSAPGASGPKADETRYVVVLWDLAARRERASLSGHTKAVRRIVFSPDGKMIVSASDDRTVRLWDASTGEERSRLPSPRYAYGLAISPDGRSIAMASGDFHASDTSEEHPHGAGLVSIWDVDARARRMSTAAHRDFATGVAFSPDGRFLASSGQDDLIKIWDAATGEERAVLKGQETHVYGLVFSPDGGTLASTGSGARLWRVDDLPEIVPRELRPLK
jgi:RNA polymerase sigma factor (sigma-70 family)